MTKRLAILLLVCVTANPAFSFLEPQGGREFGPRVVLSPETQSESGKPKDMVQIIAHRPLAARDKNGNRLYYSPNGKLMVKKNTDGTLEVSIQSQTKKWNIDGAYAGGSAKQRGTGMTVILNEKKQIIGYQESGLGNKTVREYDYHGNLSKKYDYNKYGKKLENVIIEASQLKTVFDQEGKAVYDINYEGAQVAWYKYDAKGKLVSKTDIKQNTLYYDKHGNMTHTTDFTGEVDTRYTYTQDDEGNYILDYSVNGELITYYYPTGKPSSTKSFDGDVYTDYVYDGQTLTYTYDRKLNEVTWYDIDGKPLTMTFDDQLCREWIYSRGILIALWDERADMLTAFAHGQEIGKYLLPTKPASETVQEWIDRGYLKKEYTR